MKIKSIILSIFLITLTSCAGVGSKGFFGTGVSVAFDPRSVGTQIDDSIMQKNLRAKLILIDRSYLLKVKTKVYLRKVQGPCLEVRVGEIGCPTATPHAHRTSCNAWACLHWALRQRSKQWAAATPLGRSSVAQPSQHHATRQQVLQ